MNHLTAPVIRFRHAAAAIGVTKKTLRNWLARGQVELEEEGDGWSNFSRLDLIRLAITAELIGYGMGVVPAFLAAQSSVGVATDLLASYRNTPPGVLAHAFKGHQIAICRPGEGRWSISHLKPEQQIPDEYFAAPAVLLVNCQVIADAVIERLVAALDDDAEADQAE